MTHATTTPGNKTNEGYKIKRFREILGIKQDALASILGDDWNQQKVSLLEQKEVVDDAIMKQVAEALQVPVEAIKGFTEEAAINIVSSTLHDNAGSINNNCSLTFNPIDKWIEAMEENKKLYERILRDKDDMIETLKAIIEKK